MHSRSILLGSRALAGRRLLAASAAIALAMPSASEAVVASYSEGQAVLGTGASIVNMPLGTVDIMSTGWFSLKSNCSGVALTDTLVLTAAHCLYGNRLNLVESRGMFGIYRPESLESIGVAQGSLNPMTERQLLVGGAIKFNSNVGGLVDAAAWIPNNTGAPDLAVVRVQPRAGQTTTYLLPGPTLHRPGESLARIDPAQGSQERGQGESMVNPMVGGFSAFDGNRRNQAGTVMPDPDMFRNETLGAEDRRWAGFVYGQEAAQVKRYAGTAWPLPGVPSDHTERSTNVRLIVGDSGGPLVARMTNGALRVVGVASVGGLSTVPTPAINPADANWLAVAPYLDVIDSMIAALVALPTSGSTSRYPILYRALDLDGADYVGSFEAVARFRSNFFYFSHVQGLSDRLLVSDRSVPIRALDFGDQSLSGLLIRGRNAAGELVPIGFTVGSDGVVTLSSAQTEIEFEGLESAPGSALALGIRFDTIGFGQVVQSVQWRSVGFATVVPEPGRAVLSMIGLLALGWWVRHLRRS